MTKVLQPGQLTFARSFVQNVYKYDIMKSSGLTARFANDTNTTPAQICRSVAGLLPFLDADEFGKAIAFDLLTITVYTTQTEELVGVEALIKWYEGELFRTFPTATVGVHY